MSSAPPRGRMSRFMTKKDGTPRFGSLFKRQGRTAPALPAAQGSSTTGTQPAAIQGSSMLGGTTSSVQPAMDQSAIAPWDAPPAGYVPTGQLRAGIDPTRPAPPSQKFRNVEPLIPRTSDDEDDDLLDGYRPQGQSEVFRPDVTGMSTSNAQSATGLDPTRPAVLAPQAGGLQQPAVMGQGTTAAAATTMSAQGGQTAAAAYNQPGYGPGPSADASTVYGSANPGGPLV